MFTRYAQCRFKVVHCNLSPVLIVKHSNLTPSNFPPPFYLSVQAGEDGTKREDDKEKHVEEDYSIGFVDQRHVCTYTQPLDMKLLPIVHLFLGCD